MSQIKTSETATPGFPVDISSSDGIQQVRVIKPYRRM